MHEAGLGRRAALALALVGTLALAGHAARAEQVVLAGQTVEVAPPSGYCALDRGRTSEAAILDTLEKAQGGTNRIVIVFVDCKALDTSRQSGKYDLSRYGMILTPTPNGDQSKYSEGTRQDYVAELGKQFPDFDPASAVEAAKTRLKAAGMSVGSVRMLGLLAKDETAIYLGVSAEGVADPSDNSQHRVLGILGLTLVNEIPISINIYRSDAGDDAIAGMIAEDKANIAALIAANAATEAESARWRVMGIDLGGVGTAALTGAAIGGLIGLVLYFIRRLRKSGTS